MSAVSEFSNRTNLLRNLEISRECKSDSYWTKKSNKGAMARRSSGWDRATERAQILLEQEQIVVEVRSIVGEIRRAADSPFQHSESYPEVSRARGNPTSRCNKADNCCPHAAARCRQQLSALLQRDVE